MQKHQIYYPSYGSPLSGRTFTSDTSMKYRFGFNKQEKDDEVYGEGNVTTAEYWEYDARLGRRWNLDPVFKEWQSPYLCLSNAPIWRMDPKGDDDFFNADGTFRKHEDNGSNYIYINENVGKVEKYIKLTNFNFQVDKNGNGTTESNKIFSNIADHYSPKGKDNFSYEIERRDPYASTTIDDKKILLSVDAKGHLYDLMGNANNLKSILVHERFHQRDKTKTGDITTASYSRGEINAYLHQFIDPSFEATTKDFKKEMINQCEGYLDGLDMVTSKNGSPSEEVTKYRVMLLVVRKLHDIPKTD